MGWLWPAAASAAPSWDSPSPAVQKKPSSPSDSQLSAERPAAPSPAPASATTPKTLSRDEVADQELQAFLQEMNDDSQPKKKKYTRLSRQQQQTSPDSSASADRINAEGELPISEQILPKTMSCRQAFDEAFYCNSLGGKLNDIYRYGGLQSCSENWSAFWFCMRTKGYGAERKEEAIQDHYRHRESLKYPRNVRGKSSEDIWKSRDKKIEPGQAFSVPIPEFNGDDEEWNRQERERRKRRVMGSM